MSDDIARRQPQAGPCARGGQSTGPSIGRFFYGWIIVAVSFITLFLVVGTRFSLGVFYVAMLEDFQWSHAETAQTGGGERVS